MSDPLYERYKETLRAGHVAVLRGRLDEAIEAYSSASDVAPERALPHTSLGGVLLDLGRADDALAEFHAALDIAPQDEGALLGRSEALVRVGQPIAAAEALDSLAEVLLAAGRDADAVETLQRALVLEERVGRRRQYQRALRSLRMSRGDRASDEALGRALGILDMPTAHGAADAGGEAAPATAEGAAPPEPLPGTVETGGEPADAAGDEPVAAAGIPGALEAAGDLAEDSVRPDGGVADRDETAVADVDVDAVTVPEAEADVAKGIAEPPVPTDPARIGEASLEAGVAALAAGDRDAALMACRDAARTFLEAGLLVAALDACRDALEIDPDDVDVHLQYAAVFRARGWRDLATSRIVNLLRLVDLGGDGPARERICAEVAAVHGDDERLTGLCV